MGNAYALHNCQCRGVMCNARLRGLTMQKVLHLAFPGRLVLPLCVIFLLVQGCTAQGVTQDPVNRVFTWFSYMNGDDLRAVCTQGATDRYRLIYNARWTEQVRSYDIVAARPLPGTQGIGVPVEAELTAQAFAPAPIFNAYLARLNGGEATQTAQVRVAPDIFATLEAAIWQVATQPESEANWLRSDRYFWLVMGCREGAFRLRGFEVTPQSHDALIFLAPLQSIDPAVQPLAPPRVLPDQPYAQTAGERTRREVRFRVQVRNNHVVGQ